MKSVTLKIILAQKFKKERQWQDLMLLSETSGGVSIISFPSVIEASAGTASASFTLLFSLMTRIIRKKY